MDPRKLIKQRSSFQSFLFYSSIFTVGCLLIIGYQISYSSNYKANTIDTIAYNLGVHQNEYAVIIDAGSTGSRIMALSFYKSGFDGSLKLVADIFVQNKPGLSSFAENPQKGAAKIEELLEHAKRFIPEEDWSRTPIAVKATAGLRLLPSQQAEALLEEVRKIINNSPFHSKNDAVSIMDGQDEGLYSWFTVNFLLDKLSEARSESVATIDLGGGSVQITFIPKGYKRFVGDAKKYLHSVSIMRKKIDLYSYSYLGLGLMAIRNEIFFLENVANATDLRSSCVHESVKGKKFKYGSKTYFVKGNMKSNDVKKCSELTQAIVAKNNVDKAVEIFDREIYAFSYFFDRAFEIGMTDKDGGTVTIEDYRKLIEKYCAIPPEKSEFVCLDLTIIVALLEQGFGLRSNTPIELVDKIDGHEISWAIGAAYSILSDER